MRQEQYAFTRVPERFYYDFFSVGPQGKIKKVVEYYRIPGVATEVYNLSFGDWDERESRMNDKANTNNADRDKVLATVAATVVDFLNHHPDASIFAAGSTDARTRLYQMGISRLWEEISNTFQVEGFINGNWQPFQKGVNYSSFLLKMK
jgi:hypothetical protein